MMPNRDSGRTSIPLSCLRWTLVCVASFVGAAAFSARAQASFAFDFGDNPVVSADAVLEGMFKVNVSVVGTGVADSTKYAGDDLTAFTKQANDYASAYSRDYLTTINYKISYTDDGKGKLTFDAANSTITFTNAAFTTLPISLTNVTGDFTKNEFTKFEFNSLKWYPDLEKKYAIKNNTLKGAIDLTDPKNPVVDMTAAYTWLETRFSGGKGPIKQPAAELVYTMKAKAAPGDGPPWDPTPPGPSGVPEPGSLTMLLFGLGSFALVSAIRRRTGNAR